MFDADKFPQIKEKLINWWSFGEQEKPCVLASVLENPQNVPDTDDMKKFWLDIDFRIERALKTVENTRYYCQAVPTVNLDFAASSMCACLGCNVDYVNRDTVWAWPFAQSIEQCLDITLDKNNLHYRTIRELNQKFAALKKPHHYVTIFPLEGMTDILSGLYGTENFLMDLVAKPEEVKRAMKHFKEIWMEAFRDVQDIISQSGNQGCINWAGIWAPGTTFPLQEDTSYMLSPEMFREFCVEHISDLAEFLEYGLYHLDGIPAINFLDSLLDIPAIKAVQWVPGAGNFEITQWFDLVKRILKAGKSVQLLLLPEDIVKIDELIANVGAKGVLISFTEPLTKDQAMQLQEKYG